MADIVIDGVTTHRDPITRKIGNSTVTIIPPDPYPTYEEQYKINTVFCRVMEKAMARIARESEEKSKKVG